MKKAVLLIHGIGEQRPMSTLRSFVSALVGDANYSSKPQKISNSYELRKLKFKGQEIEIDFYEYYWAYRFRDSKYAHIFSWAKELFCSDYIPEKLKWIKTLIRSLVIFLFLGYLVYFFDYFSCIEGILNFCTPLITFFKFIIPFVIAYVGKIVLDYIGDAARYLNSAPDNIAERQLIKKDGIEILKSLINSKEYEKVIVVGHSLGSVIGYDIIKHTWIEYHNKIELKKMRSNGNPQKLTSLENLEWAAKNLNSNKATATCFQCLQDKLWVDQNLWKVSDFVTLGSPLTYADFLLSKNEEEFQLRTEQRELPKCPPVSNSKDKQRESIQETKFGYYNKDNDEIEHLNHSAIFALTKWTNIYYIGDIIGGKLRPLFGLGINDIEATLFSNRKKNIDASFSSHTKYWTSTNTTKRYKFFGRKKEESVKNKSLEELKKIIL